MVPPTASVPQLAGCIPGRLAIVTGAAAQGIGYAMVATLATRYLMKVALIDISQPGLDLALSSLVNLGVPKDNIRTFKMDVSRREDWEHLRNALGEEAKEIGYLGLNAGIGLKSSTYASGSEMHSAWEKTLGVNLFGVIYGSQTLVPEIISGKRPATIVITGSKQGITCPPGNPAYNASKAAVKTFAEALQHELRSSPESRHAQAHLLVPGWVNSKMTNPSGGPKAEGSWTPEQTVDYAFAKFSGGSFYSICPDNEVSEATDLARMEWTAFDVVKNRAPLSRWHPSYKEEFDAYMKGKTSA